MNRHLKMPLLLILASLCPAQPTELCAQPAKRTAQSTGLEGGWTAFSDAPFESFRWLVFVNEVSSTHMTTVNFQHAGSATPLNNDALLVVDHYSRRRDELLLFTPQPEGIHVTNITQYFDVPEYDFHSRFVYLKAYIENDEVVLTVRIEYVQEGRTERITKSLRIDDILARSRKDERSTLLDDMDLAVSDELFLSDRDR